MSYTLIFKKGDVEILSLGVGHALSKAFVNKPYDHWEKMDKSEFADAIKTLILQDESLQNNAEMWKKMVEHASDTEERWDALTRIHDIKAEHRVIERAKVMLDMLEMIWDEGTHTDYESNVGLEWAVF